MERVPLGEQRRRVPLLEEQASAVAVLKISLPKMSTQNTSKVGKIEQLCDALFRAKFARLQADAAEHKAREALVSAEVDAKVAANVVAQIERELAAYVAAKAA